MPSKPMKPMQTNADAGLGLGRAQPMPAHAAQWRAAASGFKRPKGLAQKPNPLPGGYRKFTASVEKLVAEISAKTVTEPPHVIREAASVMAVSHFFHIDQLYLAEDTDFNVASKKPAVRALLRRLGRWPANLRTKDRRTSAGNSISRSWQASAHHLLRAQLRQPRAAVGRRQTPRTRR